MCNIRRRVVLFVLTVLPLASMHVVANPTPAPASLNELAQEIMQHHEKVTGIVYPEREPKIFFDGGMLGQTNIARYYFESRIILLHARFQTCDFEHIRAHLHDPIIPNTPECSNAEVRSVLSHELAHWLTHMLILHQRPRSWLKHYFTADSFVGPNTFQGFMVIEGIGEYFGTLMGEYTHAPFPDGAWEERLKKEDFYNRSKQSMYLYDGGHDIVRSIFVAQGVKEGMFWILANQPKIRTQSLKGALEYKKRGTNPTSQKKKL